MTDKEITVDNYDEETYEVVGSTPEVVEPEFQEQNEESEETTEVVEPEEPQEDKSVAHFQRVAQEKHDLAMKIQAEKDAEIQALKEQLANNTPKQEVAKEEAPQYPRPADPEDTLDQLRFARELAEYTQKTFDMKSKLYDEKLNEINAEREQAKRERIFKQERSARIGEFVTNGMSVDKAAKVYEFGYSQASIDPKNLEAYYDLVMNKKTPTAHKTNTLNNAPLPVGVGETETESSDPHEQFYQEGVRPQKKWL